MNIPEVKLLITLDWHLGIPDGQRYEKKLIDYTDDELVITEEIEALAYANISSISDGRFIAESWGETYYIISTNDNGNVATATTDKVLSFKGMAFKLEEVGIY